MKIALCLQGLSHGKSDKGIEVSFLDAAKMLKKSILSENDVDIFIHTWSESKEENDRIENIYRPKKSIYEKQIMFDKSPTKLHSTKSRWYSHMKSVELKKKYEKENGFKYDFVLVSRFDNCFITKFDFSNYEKGFFYSPTWYYPHSEGGFLDYWFFSDSETMDKYSNLYEELDTYLLKEKLQLSNHVLSKYHAEAINLQCKCVKKWGQDYCLQRELHRGLERMSQQSKSLYS